MVKSMYSGISGLRAHQSKMDVIGNNIANVNTYGFKSGRVTFKESIYQTSSSSSSGNDIYGGSNASQIGYGSQVGTIDLLMANGSYAPTDSSTDCMIDGQGFFLVGAKGDAIALEEGTSDLLSGLSLTRVGNFQFDGDGYLVDGSGNVVYGYRGTTVDGSWVGNTSELQPIRIPDAGGGYEETPVTLNSIRIDATGEVIGTNTDGTIVTVGMIALSNVPNP
ncbi:MAG: flagellar hook-basal body complex protein, partial [Anaerotignaceae bacterium]